MMLRNDSIKAEPSYPILAVLPFMDRTDWFARRMSSCGGNSASCAPAPVGILCYNTQGATHQFASQHSPGGCWHGHLPAVRQANRDGYTFILRCKAISRKFLVFPDSTARVLDVPRFKIFLRLYGAHIIMYEAFSLPLKRW